MKVENIKYNIDKRDIEEMNEARAAVGLKPIEAGTRKCHTCGEDFESPDIEHIRRCKHCKILLEECDQDIAEVI